MTLPFNFSGAPQEDLYHHFRNVCIEFKKTVKSTKDPSKLELEMDRFINVSSHMNWHHSNSDVYHKDEGEKSNAKILREFRRYIKALQTNSSQANPQDLLDAISEVERLIKSVKVG